MKDLSVLLVILLFLGSVFCYCRNIYKEKGKELSPALSTWIIFFTATFLSFITYAAAENKDFKSGILNTLDVLGDFIILSFVVIWAKKSKKYIEPFEKMYLAGAAGIVAFWIISNNAFVSNILLQVLLIGGYFPTIEKLRRAKKNTEPMSAWVIILISAFIALYPAIIGGNILSVIYVVRAIIMIGLVLSLMIFYEIRNSKGASV